MPRNMEMVITKLHYKLCEWWRSVPHDIMETYISHQHIKELALLMLYL